MRQHFLELQNDSESGGIREYNERLILHAIRQHEEIPSADLVRETGLSVQSISRITKRLLDLGLIEKRNRRRVRGKVGQPSVPLALKAEGAYSIGVKIGRKSLDIVVIDFEGNVKKLIEHNYDYPTPEHVLPKINAGIDSILSDFTLAERSRIVGIGIVAPYGLGERSGEMKSPPGLAESWSTTNVRAAILNNQDYPIWFEHDAKAACLADMLLHRPTLRPQTYAYIFIGVIVGGGIVIDGMLSHGPHGYAGAFGPMPVPMELDPEPSSGKSIVVPLLKVASRYVVNEMLEKAGYDPESVLSIDITPKEFEIIPEGARVIIDAWVERAGSAIAIAIMSSISTLDFEAIVIDGDIPVNLLTKLNKRVTEELDQQDFTGLKRPKLLSGDLGNRARAMGGALLPLYSKFAPERELLFNQPNT
ncbi:MAG: ROK family transcriptional regulator [Alphaproteobacteria bacterium]